MRMLDPSQTLKKQVSRSDQNRDKTDKRDVMRTERDVKELREMVVVIEKKKV